jgi:hypothetical protein
MLAWRHCNFCLTKGGDIENGVGNCTLASNDSNVTPLHLAVTASRTDDQSAALDILFRHGANPLALTSWRSTALLLVTSCTVAIERDYWLARKGRRFDPTTARKSLLTRNKF